MPLLGKGNRKLGPGVLTWSTTAGRTCPGASTYCEVACYAKKGAFRYSSVADGLSRHADMIESDLDAWAVLMRLELARKKDGTVVRIHVSGDFATADYVDAWRAIAADFPRVTFYAYTRSWSVPGFAESFDALKALPNVRVWASVDYTMPTGPEGWNTATLYRTAEDAAADGATVCPEQRGVKPDCSSCGLCWKVRPDAGFKLGFVEH